MINKDTAVEYVFHVKTKQVTYYRKYFSLKENLK